MSLPSALAVKLAKRGILANSLKPFDKDKRNDAKGASGCPNKSNIYHDCNYWCETHWKGVLTPDPRYMRNTIRLTQKYPLPHSWMEVFDRGLGRYYYWDMETDLVSWLPPKHPKAVLTDSAAKQREKRLTAEEDRHSWDEERVIEKRYHTRYENKKDRARDKESDSYSEKRQKYEDRRRRSRKDDIDPMDPAAYSDIPQGTWSNGLNINKSVTDSTISGAMYQQRPYPAPGEVLASNANGKLKSKKNVNFSYLS